MSTEGGCVLQQRHEARFASSMTVVFSELVRVLAKGRWGTATYLTGTDQLPRRGHAYVLHRGSLTRRGRVIECLPPVALSLYESLSDPPCRVRLRLRWRVEPLECSSLVLLNTRYELNGPAYLNRRHWRARIHSHCVKLLAALEAGLGAGDDQGVATDKGQNTGSSSITKTNTTRVNGSPTFK